jgi:hypothetical protein
MRATCSTLESAMRTRVLGVLALTSGGRNGYQDGLEKLKSLASGCFRNVSCAHTLCLSGDWTVYTPVTTPKPLKLRFFRKPTQTMPRMVPTYDAALAPGSTSTYVQPLDLLSTILTSATNVSRVR